VTFSIRERESKREREREREKERESKRDSICQDHRINMWVLVMIEICIRQTSAPGHQSTP